MSQTVFESDGRCFECGVQLRPFLLREGEKPDLVDGLGNYAPCPRCFQIEYECMRQKYLRPRKINWLLRKSKLPPLFLEKTFDNFKIYDLRQEKVLRECRSFAEDFPDRQDRGSCLLFMGPCGTGKGHLSAAIIRGVIEAHMVTALFEKYIDLKKRIQRSWDRDVEEDEEEIMKSVRAPALLVLDEIGVQFKSKFERLILYQIVNHRCEYLRPTILTTNYDLGKLKEVVGERVFDRILNKESGNKVFAFNWPSYRRTLGGKT